MDKTIVIFILSVIILYAALGVVASTALQGYLSNNKNTSALNQTNSSLNVNNTTQTNSQNNLISPTKAIIIVNKNIPANGYTSISAKLLQNGTHPYYLVNAYDQNSTNYKQTIGDAKVDAKTGKFLGNGTVSN